MGVAPALSFVDATPAARAAAARPASVRASAAAICLQVRLGRRVIGLTRVREQPLQAQAGKPGDVLDERDGRPRVRIDPAAVEADIHLDQDVDCHARRASARDQASATRGWSTMKDTRVRAASAIRRSAFAGFNG